MIFDGGIIIIHSKGGRIMPDIQYDFNIYQDLKGNSFKILTLFFIKMNDKGIINISLNEISRHLNLTKTTVVSILKELEKHEVVKVFNHQEQSQHIPNTYQVLVKRDRLYNDAQRYRF